MEITNNVTQVVADGGFVTFTTDVIPGNCSMIHRAGSGLVKLRGLTTSQSRARFRVFFSCNMAQASGTIAPTELYIAVDGEQLPSTLMVATPAATAEYFQVSTEVIVDVPKNCCSTISIVNASGNPLSITAANLIIDRVA